MGTLIKKTFELLHAIQRYSRIEVNRSKVDFFSDKIIQAGAQKNFISFIEQLGKLMDTDFGAFNSFKIYWEEKVVRERESNWCRC